MKTKQIGKKLVLTKTTIASLDEESLKKVNGGTNTTRCTRTCRDESDLNSCVIGTCRGC
jgi:natural product precursor